MKSRTFTALALIPPVVYVLGWAPEWLFLLVLIAVAELCLREYFAICRHAGFQPMAGTGYAAGAIICLGAAAYVSRLPLALPVFAAVPLLILCLAMFGTPDLKHYLGKVACTLFGLLYIPGTLAVLVPLRYPSGVPSWEIDRLRGRFWMLLLFAAIWGGDILAYFVGRMIGRRPLVPRISPKKTVEGAIGGLLGSVLAALGVRLAFARVHPNLKMSWLILIVLLVALAGQAGDLVESALKRGAEIKDSGSLLPGHGGMLDRLDSLLFAAPTLWLVLTAVGNQ